MTAELLVCLVVPFPFYVFLLHFQLSFLLLMKELAKLGLVLFLLAEGSSYLVIYIDRLGCDNLESRLSCRLNSVLHVPSRLCQVEDAFLVLFLCISITRLLYSCARECFLSRAGWWCCFNLFFLFHR